MKKIIKKLTPFISIIFFAFALWFLHEELQQYNMAEVMTQLADIPNHYILFSLILSALSYLLLTGYDALAVRYIGEKLEPGKIIRAGFVGYAFSHNIGLALITGGSIRYRIYSVWGFSGLQVTQIMAFSSFTLWIGFCAIGGLALIFATPNLPNDVMIPFVSLRILGVILLLMVIAYIWASYKFKKEINYKSWSFEFPDSKLALRQVAIASVDWLLMASVLYVLLPDVGVSFFSFVGAFLLAQIAGLFSQVPGGLGVFESIMLMYLTNFMPGSQVLSILVVYRIIYYILPLLGALVVLGYQEYIVNRRKMKVLQRKAASWVPRVVPQVMSFSIFVGGTILLFSGALPSDVPRMEWLQHFIPLPVIEMSHFFASLVGAALLVLASGLQRRSDGAYHLTIGLLVFGILFSLLKGADYEEASILSVMLVALLPCRDEFHRKASLFDQLFSARWFTLIVMVLASAIWLGTFSYGHVEYQKDLWWQFSLMGDAPRYMRAMVAVLGFSLIAGLIKLLRPKHQETVEPGEQELIIAKEIIRKSQEALSNLVLLGDKELLISEDRNSFIMFGRESQNWIALGDPVGDQDEAEDLIWEFYDQCTSEGFSPIFYQTGEQYLDHYVDLGLTLYKLGEEAHIPLKDFDPQETINSNIWSGHKQLKERGYTFEILSPNAFGRYLPELQSISEESLAARNKKERGFSVGYFDEAYLSNFPIAVVKKEGQMLAFSNILTGSEKHELTTDLLRYRPESPVGIIDFMLIETMLWGHKQEYSFFNLGMAPLSGMEEHDFSPGWSKLANFVYTYGENIYGFKKVRMYKRQFNPEWHPKFLVGPGGWALPRVLSSLTNIVSGGFESIMSKR
ncbi:bifunctional lysylphosphatidylglycerol flippase/synthetase MprF [Fodinibius sp. Rm-B-1B1-1]|uniref:bifunctional lysylphosphatidylglycerol flippase/synthetase MprF n=1 Tax=Fodinibius alkaliphilus TaxID=3140241 RepID=UPI0031599B3E